MTQATSVHTSQKGHFSHFKLPGKWWRDIWWFVWVLRYSNHESELGWRGWQIGRLTRTSPLLDDNTPRGARELFFFFFFLFHTSPHTEIWGSYTVFGVGLIFKCDRQGIFYLPLLTQFPPLTALQSPFLFSFFSFFLFRKKFPRQRRKKKKTQPFMDVDLGWT